MEKVGRELERKLKARAATKIGFLHLVSQEGGVVSAKEAAVLYGGQTLMTDQAAVRRAARLCQLIAVKDGRGKLLFPVWQFSGEGGALPGLRETLVVLRQHPHFHDLLPFTFILNARARLGGKRPLDLLRTAQDDDLRLVLKLADEAAE